MFLVKVVICRTRLIRGTNTLFSSSSRCVTHTHAYTHDSVHAVGVIVWYLPTIPLNTHVCIIYSVTYTYIYTYTCMHILSIFLFPFAKKKIEGKALLFPPGIYTDVPYPFYSCSCVHLTRPSYPFRLALFEMQLSCGSQERAKEFTLELLLG